MPRGIPNKKKIEKFQDEIVNPSSGEPSQPAPSGTTDQAPEQKPAPHPDSSRARDLERKIAALEAKLKAGEEAALERVCKALKLDPSEVKTAEKATPRQEAIIRCFVPFPIRINMNIYQGTVEVPYSVFEVIQQALGDRRQRLLRELTGNDYLLQEIGGVGYVPKLVGQVDITGEKFVGVA